jgi:hypothetical protein
MDRRIPAVAAALLALTWLAVGGVQFSSGEFGRETKKIQLENPAHSHAFALGVAVCGVAIWAALLGGLLLLAVPIRRGSRRAEYAAVILSTVILTLTAQHAFDQRTNIGQWLGVALDLAVIAAIALDVRLSAGNVQPVGTAGRS